MTDEEIKLIQERLAWAAQSEPGVDEKRLSMHPEVVRRLISTIQAQREALAPFKLIHDDAVYAHHWEQHVSDDHIAFYGFIDQRHLTVGDFRRAAQAHAQEGS